MHALEATTSGDCLALTFSLSSFTFLWPDVITARHCKKPLTECPRVLYKHWFTGEWFSILCMFFVS